LTFTGLFLGGILQGKSDSVMSRGVLNVTFRRNTTIFFVSEPMTSKPSCI